MELTVEFKQKVINAVMESRTNYGGTDSDFSKKLGISNSIFSRLKKGETDKILADGVWLRLGREHNVSIKTSRWKLARTHVYDQMESNLNFCQEFSIGTLWVDESGIGKTEAAKDILRRMKNGFYIDCSQAKKPRDFVYLLAKTVGVDTNGLYRDVKSNLKYFLNLIENPVFGLDEYGDLEYQTILEHKEIMNATEGNVGWLAFGAEGLRKKLEDGITHKKVGYREIFRRFMEEFIRVTPEIKSDQIDFYRIMFTEIATLNLTDKSAIKPIVNQALAKMLAKKNEVKSNNKKETDLSLTSISYLKTLILLHESQKSAQ